MAGDRIGNLNTSTCMKFELSADCHRYFLTVSIAVLKSGLNDERKTSLSLQCSVVSKNGIPKSILITCKGMTVSTTRLQCDQSTIKEDDDTIDVLCKTDFRLRFGTLCLPRNPILDVWIDLEIGSHRKRVLVGNIGGHLESLSEGIEDSRYAPIIVPALGRSGTTLMMRLLNSHPEILAPGKYPFEFRQASYLWHALRILTSPANYDMSMHPDSFETKNFYSIGYNPYQSETYRNAHDLNSVSEWQDMSFPISTINFVKKMVDQYIDQALIDSNRSGVRFLAEKEVVSPLNDLVMNIYPNAKQVFIIRDLRDSFLSARAFNIKRGTKSFGFEGQTDQEVLEGRANIARILILANKFADERTLFIRYEDLVRNMEGEIKRLTEFLCIDSSKKTIKTMVNCEGRNTKQMIVHSTTKNVESSVERWRNELTVQEKAFCADAYKEFFEIFGYPIT